MLNVLGCLWGLPLSAEHLAPALVSVSHTHMHKITSFLCRSGNKGARDGEACQFSVRGVNANTLRLHRELLQRAAVGVAGTLDGRDGLAWRGGIFVQWVSAKRTGSGGLEKDGGWG